MEEPLKSENYAAIGGMNTRVSKYVTGQGEFLNLENVDFRTPGALSSFCGSTLALSSSTTHPITGVFRCPIGSSRIIATDFSIMNSSLANIVPLFVTTTSWFAGFSAPYYDFQGGIISYLTNTSEFFSFGVSGSQNPLLFSLPTPYYGAQAWAQANGGSFTPGGTISLFFAFQRWDGLIGPVIERALSTNFSGSTLGASFFRVTTPGLPPIASPASASFGSWGISGLLAWYSFNGSAPKGTSALYAPNSTFIITDAALFGNTNFTGNSFIVDNPQPNQVYGSFIEAFSGTTNAQIGSLPGYNPSSIELYNNQLFSGGFRIGIDPQTLKPGSIVWYSNITEYERRDPENFFYVRIDDGDYVTCIKNYFTQLVIFKKFSISALSGDNPDNFAVSDTTNQFGSISPLGALVWDQKLWFIDVKGIAEYNGANTTIVSDKMQSIFSRMNLSQATLTAQAIHVKERQELWFCIPIDGSTYNNVVVVYNYFTLTWSLRKLAGGIQLGAVEPRDLILVKDLPFYGSQSGSIYQFASDIMGDNGSAFTSVIKSRFVSDLGHTVEKQFRRLFTDITVSPGQTFNILVNFYNDQKSTPYQAMTFALNEYQRRIEFGIPASSLSVEYIYSGNTFLEFNGFTIEYRFQRAVTNNG